MKRKMRALRGRYKRRKDFTEEEWKEKVREAWRLRAKYGWGRVRIARELGISPNTVADWINRFKMPVKTEEQYENGIFMHRIIDAKRIIEEERARGKISEDDAEYALRLLDFFYMLCMHYPRAKQIKEEGDDSHLIYA